MFFFLLLSPLGLVTSPAILLNLEDLLEFFDIFLILGYQVVFLLLEILELLSPLVPVLLFERALPAFWFLLGGGDKVEDSEGHFRRGGDAADLLVYLFYGGGGL